MSNLRKRNRNFIVIVGLILILFSNSFNVYAAESNNYESGIYEVENDIYHESEVGMSMARGYVDPIMNVEIRKNNIQYTIKFSGTEYMENFRMEFNEAEAPIEIIEENQDEHTIKIKSSTNSINDKIEAKIYVNPMERDVKFQVIPKLDTLKLIKKIEEPKEEIKEKNDNIEKIDKEEKANVEKIDTNNTMGIKSSATLIVVVVAIVLGICAVTRRKVKK